MKLLATLLLFYTIAAADTDWRANPVLESGGMAAAGIVLMAGLGWLRRSSAASRKRKIQLDGNGAQALGRPDF